MTDITCVSPSCRKPPVAGSKYCEFHLAERARTVRNILSIFGTISAVIGAVVVGVIQIIKGRKS